MAFRAVRSKPGLQATAQIVGKPQFGSALQKKVGGAKAPKPSLANGAKSKAKAAAPQAAVGQHFVPDSIYNDAINAAQREETKQLSLLDDQERAIKFDFGLDDPTNPFSRANALKRAFLARGKSASVSLASQGQLYSGAHERSQINNRRNEEQAMAELRRTYEGALGEIKGQRIGVQNAEDQAELAAFQAWLDRAPRAEDLAAAPGGTQTSVAGGGKPMAKVVGGAMIGQGAKNLASPVAKPHHGHAYWRAQKRHGKYRWPDGKGYVHSRAYRGN